MTDERVSEEQINIRYSDLDYDKSLKPFSLLNFFQDIASDNAEKLGFGYSAIYPKNLMWVLLKYRIEFKEYPQDIQCLTLKTEPRGYNRLFAYRNFELADKDKVFARASSMWSLVDFKTMSLANIEDSVSSLYMAKMEPQKDDLSFAKIPSISKCDIEKEFEVRYNDIDVNGHANNGTYIVWALEPLPFEFRTKHKLKVIDMSFKKEVRLGEKLISKVQFLDCNKTVHSLVNADTQDDLCLVACSWGY